MIFRSTHFSHIKYLALALLIGIAGLGLARAMGDPFDDDQVGIGPVAEYSGEDRVGAERAIVQSVAEQQDQRIDPFFAAGGDPFDLPEGWINGSDRYTSGSLKEAAESSVAVVHVIIGDQQWLREPTLLISEARVIETISGPEIGDEIRLVQIAGVVFDGGKLLRLAPSIDPPLRAEVHYLLFLQECSIKGYTEHAYCVGGRGNHLRLAGRVVGEHEAPSDWSEEMVGTSIDEIRTALEGVGPKGNAP